MWIEKPRGFLHQESTSPSMRVDHGFGGSHYLTSDIFLTFYLFVFCAQLKQEDNSLPVIKRVRVFRRVKMAEVSPREDASQTLHSLLLPRHLRSQWLDPALSLFTIDYRNSKMVYP